MSASSTRAPAAAASGRQRASNCAATSSPRCDSEAARVVMRPPDIETSSAGIAVTRPSPMVRMVYCCAAVPTSTPCWKTPITRPAAIFTPVMSTAASASRWVKRIAPSIEP